MAENAARLCAADDGHIWQPDGTALYLVASRGARASRSAADTIGRQSVVGRAVLDRVPVHVPDLAEALFAEFPDSWRMQELGYRTILAVPLLREGMAIGVIMIRRTEVQPFTDDQIELVTTFADQGVIAIENVRLFRELQTRTQDLTRSVGELQALSEVTHAVTSTLDLETVLATIVSRAVQLSGSEQGLVYEFDEATETFHQRVTHQITAEHVEAVRAAPIRLGEGAMGRAGVIREPVQVADIEGESELVAPQVRGLIVREGMRSLLAVPLVREDRLLGGLVIMRRERGAFSPETVATLQTFATQSVLAIHNARLFREIQRQKQYADALVETSPVAITTVDVTRNSRGVEPGCRPALRLYRGRGHGAQRG